MENFSSAIIIWGIDDSIRSYKNFVKATYHAAPPRILMRLYGEFLISARKGLGDSDTDVTLLDILGIRINDIYEAEERRAFEIPFEQLASEEGWQIPWGAPAADGSDAAPSDT